MKDAAKFNFAAPLRPCVSIRIYEDCFLFLRSNIMIPPAPASANARESSGDDSSAVFTGLLLLLVVFLTAGVTVLFGLGVTVGLGVGLGSGVGVTSSAAFVTVNVCDTLTSL